MSASQQIIITQNLSDIASDGDQPRHFWYITGATAAQKKDAKQLETWLKQDFTIDNLSKNLAIATPLLEALSALLGMLGSNQLETFLKTAVEEHDSEIRSSPCVLYSLSHVTCNLVVIIVSLARPMA